VLEVEVTDLACRRSSSTQTNQLCLVEPERRSQSARVGNRRLPAGKSQHARERAQHSAPCERQARPVDHRRGELQPGRRHLSLLVFRHKYRTQSTHAADSVHRSVFGHRRLATLAGQSPGCRTIFSRHPSSSGKTASLGPSIPRARRRRSPTIQRPTIFLQTTNW
jgi:hypothetical protein